MAPPIFPLVAQTSGLTSTSVRGKHKFFAYELKPSFQIEHLFLGWGFRGRWMDEMGGRGPSATRSGAVARWPGSGVGSWETRDGGGCPASQASWDHPRGCGGGTLHSFSWWPAHNSVFLITRQHMCSCSPRHSCACLLPFPVTSLQSAKRKNSLTVPSRLPHCTPSCLWKAGYQHDKGR